MDQTEAIRSRADDVRKTLVAFANSLPDGEGAVLFIGVSDDGKPLGGDTPDDRQKKVRRWADRCYPPLDLTTKPI